MQIHILTCILTYIHTVHTYSTYIQYIHTYIHTYIGAPASVRYHLVLVSRAAASDEQPAPASLSGSRRGHAYGLEDSLELYHVHPAQGGRLGRMYVCMYVCMYI